MRPSEVFSADYMIFPWRHITAEELDKIVWPIGTYASAVFVLIFLFVTDFLRYKPVIVLGGVAAIATWALLVWSVSFEAAIVIQFTFAIFFATEIAYYTYIYAKVDKEHFMKVTSHTRAAILCGKCCAGFLAQVIVYSRAMNLRGLNCISCVMVTGATFYALLLPPVTKSLYFEQSNISDFRVHSKSAGGGNGNDRSVVIEEIQSECSMWTRALNIMAYQLKTAFTNRCILLWSFWYIIGLCGFYQVNFYIQMLWITIDNRPVVRWNGAVDVCINLLGSSVVLLASRLRDHTLKSTRILWVLVVIATLQACSVFIATNTMSRFVSYAGYMMFYVLHSFAITVSSAEIAKRLPDDSYGLIFGINTFIALVIQSILTLIVVSDTFGFDFDIKQQFNIYGWCYVALALIYLVPILFKLINFDANVSIITENTCEKDTTKIV